MVRGNGRSNQATAATRGVAAAMAMTGLRTVTKGLGLLEEPPPDAIAERGVPSLFARVPPEHRAAAVELSHWAFGAAAGTAFALLPERVRRRRVAGPAYGLAVWLAFETVLAPVLGLRPESRPARERLMLALDHALYGAIVGARPRRI
jgi:hypothetical protein